MFKSEPPVENYLLFTELTWNTSLNCNDVQGPIHHLGGTADCAAVPAGRLHQLLLRSFPGGPGMEHPMQCSVLADSPAINRVVDPEPFVSVRFLRKFRIRIWSCLWKHGYFFKLKQNRINLARSTCQFKLLSNLHFNLCTAALSWYL